MSADLEREAESIDDASVWASSGNILYHIRDRLMSQVMNRPYDSETVSEGS